jgi:hypothetical protein
MGICFLIEKKYDLAIPIRRCLIISSFGGLITCICSDAFWGKEIHVRNVIELYQFYLFMYISLLVSFLVTKYAFLTEKLHNCVIGDRK